jgi:ribonuclease HI
MAQISKKTKFLQNLKSLSDFNSQTSSGWVGFFDGACSPNPGRIGIGAWLQRDGRKIYSRSDPAFGFGSNNTAEYEALLALLEMISDNSVEDILICGDSELVIFQVSGKWETKKPHLRLYRDRARELSETIPGVRWAWIPREFNWVADALSKGKSTAKRPRGRKTNMT